LAIGDCRLPIDGLGIEGLGIGLKIGEWIEDCRGAIGVRNRSIANPIANDQSPLVNRQSPIQSALDNRQSVNRHSAIGNRK
jgi:hypothetical protein